MEKVKELQETIDIVVELELPLMRFADPKEEEAQSFRRHLLQYLDDLLADMTIPAKISLIIAHTKNKNRSAMTSYQVRINGHKCRLPIPSLVSQDVQALELARSVARGVYRNPELFITISLAERIKERWASENREEYILTSLPPNEFHELLVELVQRYFRIDRARKLSQVLRKWWETGATTAWDARRSFEECISDWSALTLKILLPHSSPFNSAEDAEMQSPTNDTQTKKMLEMMRDGLFYELGVMVPKVAISIDEKLEEGEFRIQLNDLRLPAIRGLRQGHFLVNDTVDRLSLIKISGEPTINPANESKCAIVRDENGNREICEEAGLTTWDPEGFVILALSAEFRRNADAFLTEESVRYSMNQLQLAFPALIDTVEERFSTSELTGILRDLLEEECFIRDLRGILEALLAIHALVPRKPDRAPPIVENLPGYAKPQVDRNKAVESLRTAFKRYISKKHAKDGKTMIAFLLDPEIEMRIMNAERQCLKTGDEDHDKLVEAIFDELRDVPAASLNAVILTTLEVRKRLRSLIEKEFPGLAVLCYQELDPDLNIQPVSRISLQRGN